MKAVVERCAGIDVAKDILNVCAMCGPADQDPSVELEKFRTFNAELDRLRQRLGADRVDRALDALVSEGVVERTGDRAVLAGG